MKREGPKWRSERTDWGNKDGPGQGAGEGGVVVFGSVKERQYGHPEIKWKDEIHDTTTIDKQTWEKPQQQHHTDVTCCSNYALPFCFTNPHPHKHYYHHHWQKKQQHESEQEQQHQSHQDGLFNDLARVLHGAHFRMLLEVLAHSPDLQSGNHHGSQIYFRTAKGLCPVPAIAADTE